MAAATEGGHNHVVRAKGRPSLCGPSVLSTLATSYIFSIGPYWIFQRWPLCISSALVPITLKANWAQQNNQSEGVARTA